MKKKLVVSLFSFLVIVGLMSCASIHTGYMNNSVALSQPNFSYVQRNIQGVSNATYILGIGGLSKETLVNSAKMNLMDIALLKDNQALVNTTVNFRNSYYLGVVIIVTCTVTADVVEFK
jgi:hypothetical protein